MLAASSTTTAPATPAPDPDFWQSFSRAPVYVTAGVSLFLALFIVLLYVARRIVPTIQRMRSEENYQLDVGGGLSFSDTATTRRTLSVNRDPGVGAGARGTRSSAALGRTASNAAVGTTSGTGLLMPGTAPGQPLTDWDHWPDPLRAIGVDLGSHMVKCSSYKNGAVRKATNTRCVVCLTHRDGLVAGDAKAAIEHFDCAMFSCLRSMAYMPDNAIQLDGVRVPPAQATGAVIRAAIGERSTGLPVVGVSVAPQFAPGAHLLYLAAMSAGLDRFFLFHQAAALIAALLAYRAGTTGKAKPARLVVFADCGESGVSSYVCEVRESSGSMLCQAWRREGLEIAVDAMHRGLLEQLRGQADEALALKVAEAADELRQEFSELPDHLLHTRRVARTVDDDATVSMDREDYIRWFQPALNEVEAVAKEIGDFLRSHASLHGAEPIEIVLTGGMFRVPDVRQRFVDPLAPYRRGGASTVTHGKVSVAEGNAMLAAMRHPGFSKQRYDIAPLFQLRTIDQSGYREVIDDSRSSVGRSSLLSPFIRRSTSNFVGRPGPAARARGSSLAV